MAGRKSDFTLPKFDDIFSTQEMRDDEKLAKIRDIPLELIDDFPDHPYKVRDDEDMMQLSESIKERGVITPARGIDAEVRVSVLVFRIVHHFDASVFHKDFHTCLDFLAVLIKILHRTFLLSDLFTHPHSWRREYKIKKGGCA